MTGSPGRRLRGRPRTQDSAGRPKPGRVRARGPRAAGRRTAVAVRPQSSAGAAGVERGGRTAASPTRGSAAQSPRCGTVRRLGPVWVATALSTTPAAGGGCGGPWRRAGRGPAVSVPTTTPAWSASSGTASSQYRSKSTTGAEVGSSGLPSGRPAPAGRSRWRGPRSRGAAGRYSQVSGTPVPSATVSVVRHVASFCCSPGPRCRRCCTGSVAGAGRVTVLPWRRWDMAQRRHRRQRAGGGGRFAGGAPAAIRRPPCERLVRNVKCHRHQACCPLETDTINGLSAGWRRVMNAYGGQSLRPHR